MPEGTNTHKQVKLVAEKESEAFETTLNRCLSQLQQKHTVLDVKLSLLHNESVAVREALVVYTDNGDNTENRSNNSVVSNTTESTTT